MLKKELEERIKELEGEIKRLNNEAKIHWELDKILRQYSMGGHMSTLVVAVEKITEAMSHTIQSLNSRR